MAINGFNFGNTKNLRAKVGGKWTDRVLKWSLDTWGDVKFRGLSAAYIAIERAIPSVSVLDTMDVPKDKRPKSAAQREREKKKGLVMRRMMGWGSGAWMIRGSMIRMRFPTGRMRTMIRRLGFRDLMLFFRWGDSFHTVVQVVIMTRRLLKNLCTT